MAGGALGSRHRNDSLARAPAGGVTAGQRKGIGPRRRGGDPEGKAYPRPATHPNRREGPRGEEPHGGWPVSRERGRVHGGWGPGAPTARSYDRAGEARGGPTTLGSSPLWATNPGGAKSQGGTDAGSLAKPRVSRAGFLRRAESPGGAGSRLRTWSQTPRGPRRSRERTAPQEEQGLEGRTPGAEPG